MSDIVANNTTLINTVTMMQKKNRMIPDKIKSLKNELTAATDKAAQATTKTYTILWPGTGNSKKMVKDGYFRAHGCGITSHYNISTCCSENKNPRHKVKATRADIMGRCTYNKGSEE